MKANRPRLHPLSLLLLLTLGLLASAGWQSARAQVTDPDQRLRMYQAHVAMAETSPLKKYQPSQTRHWSVSPHGCRTSPGNSSAPPISAAA